MSYAGAMDCQAPVDCPGTTAKRSLDDCVATGCRLSGGCRLREVQLPPPPREVDRVQRIFTFDTHWVSELDDAMAATNGPPAQVTGVRRPRGSPLSPPPCPEELAALEVTLARIMAKVARSEDELRELQEDTELRELCLSDPVVKLRLDDDEFLEELLLSRHTPKATGTAIHLRSPRVISLAGRSSPPSPAARPGRSPIRHGPVPPSPPGRRSSPLIWAPRTAAAAWSAGAVSQAGPPLGFRRRSAEPVGALAGPPHA